ncbi:MAG TPA: LamG domain-containing protein [Sedimentisphaerales bacterium]|nr:LamG domain-containing protein [Sedimentisphaerales bacterium]
MCEKLIYLVSFVLVLGLISDASAELVGQWKLDEGSGTTALDATGNGNNGTLEDGPTVVDGQFAQALAFEDSRVAIPASDSLTADMFQGSFTLSAWINPKRTGDTWQQIFRSIREDDTTNDTLFINNDGRLSWRGTVGGAWAGGMCETAPGVVPADQWTHVAVTGDGTNFSIYVNGALSQESAFQTTDGTNATYYIGGDPTWIDESYTGMIDDFRIYNHVMSEEDIKSSMENQGGAIVKAYGPNPRNDTLHEDTWVNLSWLPGYGAVSHDVYFSENFNDVDAGAESTFQGNQPSAFFVAGFPGFAYPDGLVPGTTYYWRIDEVESDGTTINKGNVWSFSVPPKIAYAPDPADGAEFVEPDTKLSWTGGFGSKLHTVYFGDNFDDVSNAAGGLPQGVATYDPGTLKLAKTYYWRVDEFDAVDTYKGDIWSFTTQGAVGSPNPANGAVDVKQTQILTWSPGVFAASHQVYFGTDKDTVKNADTGSPEYKGTRDLGAESYDPGMLQWDTTYHWRIDEVNNTNPDSPWTGILWSFTTANFLIVDDFESYNDLDPADPDSNRIFNVWIDGYDDPTNGSLVGYETPPFAEQTIVHSGNQSLPLYYDNSVGYSEATLTLTYPRDWTEKGVNTMTIWFRGDAANAAETLYVALNGSAVVTYDNLDAAQIDEWTQWNIDLQAFGVNLANVNTISLGLGNKNNPLAGGSGTMYFDDIRLYPPPPAQ